MACGGGAANAHPSAPMTAFLAPPPTLAAPRTGPRRPSQSSRRGDRLGASTHGTSKASGRMSVHGSTASRGAIVVAAGGLSDPGYWEGVMGVMTPSVDVDLSAQSLAALAVGGVLVLGHSWESIEASRGWRSARNKSAKSAQTHTVQTTTVQTTVQTTKRPTAKRTTTQAAPMTAAERKAAAAAAAAERADAVAARRSSDSEDALADADDAAVCTVTVCTNNACVKRGAKDLMRALEAGAPSVGCEVKRARCMDACAAGCVVKVNGVAGLQTFLHVAPEEAETVLELATGKSAVGAKKAAVLE